MSLRSVFFVLRTWLLYRGALFVLMGFARTEFPKTVRQQGKGFLHAFTAWDGRWYHDIVVNGYSYRPGRESNVAFFPAYPFSVRQLSKLTGDDFLAGVLLSNLLFLPALFLLFLWVKEVYGRAAGERAVRYALVFPSTHFFSCFYTESMYLLAVAGAFYAFQTRRAWLYLPFGVLAGATRPTGVVLGICLLAELVRLWHERGARPLSLRRLAPALCYAAPLLGIGLYMWHLHEVVGDPLAWSKAQAGWGRHYTSPWQSILNEFRNPLEAYRQFEAYFTMLLLPVTVLAFWRLPWPYAAFLLICTLLATSTAMCASVIRYTAGTGVVYLLLASLGPKAERWLLAPLALLGGFSATCFAAGYWAG